MIAAGEGSEVIECMDIIHKREYLSMFVGHCIEGCA